MNNRANLESYDGVEVVQLNEFSENELRAYLEMKMESAESNKLFIKEHVYRGNPLNVCEIGSGNSKLLYSLEMDNVLGEGTAYEVSSSRCRLAERFAEILHSKNVRNINSNFLDDAPKSGAYNLIVMVDIVFQIIAPLYDSAEKETMEWITKSLQDGGYLFMEIEDYANTFLEIKQNDGAVKKWVEFAEEDPFQYALHLIERDADGNIVINKTHIRRNGGEEDHFQNVIRSYSKEAIMELLMKYGFSVQIFPGSFETGEYKGTERFRVLARKAG